MVTLPQELVPGSQSVAIDSSVSIPVTGTVTATITGTPTVKTQALPPIGLTRLYGPAQPATLGSPEDDVIYTVSASPPILTVLKEIIIANTTGSASWIQLGINGAAVNDTVLLHQFSVAAHTTVILEVNIPLTAGETLNAFQQNAGDLTLTLVGTETPA